MNIILIITICLLVIVTIILIWGGVTNWKFIPKKKENYYSKLDHLTQDNSQKVMGPIQDDEALFLYSIIRGNRIRNILEIGGFSGYSAKNFLEAISIFDDGIVYTVDINPVPKMGAKHKTIIKNALDLSAKDLNNQKLGLIFFDCHDMIQKDVYNLLKNKNLIDDETIIALHDTNLHPKNHTGWSKYIKEKDEWEHQRVERELVNYLKDDGYDIFSIRTKNSDHDEKFPYRHGMTVCQKFKKFILS